MDEATAPSPLRCLPEAARKERGPVQLRMVASGRGLGLVPRAALGVSVVRGEIAIVEVTDSSLSLDVWLLQRRQPGNLR